MPSSSSSPHFDTTAPICLCCSDCYEGQGGDQGLAAGGNVRAYDGSVVFAQKDWREASGFNMPFGNELCFNNLDASALLGFGNGWMPHDLASLDTTNPAQILYKIGPNQVEAFYPTSGGKYEAAYYVRDLLYYHSSSGTSGYTLLDPEGRIREFDADGKLTSFSDAYGHTGYVSYHPTTHRLSSVEVREHGLSSSSSGDGSWRYDYHWNADAHPKVDSVILSVNGRAASKKVFIYNVDLLQSVLTYVNSSATGSADWQDSGGPGGVGKYVDAAYFTYVGSLLKCVINTGGYRRIQRVHSNLWPSPGDGTTPAFSDYAEVEYSYDGANRVTGVKTNGGTYTYGLSYAVNGTSPSSLNDWHTRTNVTRPDGSLESIYFNRIGQVILRQVDDRQASSSSSSSPVQRWYPLYQRFKEVTGQLVLSAGEDAIGSVSEANIKLVTLKAADGLLNLYGYMDGYLSSVSIKQGESTGSSASHAAILRSERSCGSGISLGGLGPVFFTTSETVYRDDAGVLPSITTYTNTYYAGTFQLHFRSITLPVVSSAENGSGIAAVVDETYDTWGYLTKRVDEMGTVTEYDYDLARGGMIERRDDTGLYRMNLRTTMEVDDFGRTVLVKGPEHRIDLNGTATDIRTANWTYYQDRTFQTWQFSGYTTSTVSQIVSPVTIQTRDEVPPPGYTGWSQSSSVDAVYNPSSSSSSSPTVHIPPPSYSFTQADWVRWSLQLSDKGGQLKESRLYWLIEGGYGAKSANYGVTLYGYDSSGRQNKVTTPGGTIDRTVYNVMGWAMEEWTGTVDGGYGDNMVMTRSNVYDDDGNLTQATLVVDPSNSALDRVTGYVYDWRSRRVETFTSVEVKAGSADSWDLKTSMTYDNLDRTIMVENYGRLVPASSSSSGVSSYVRTAKSTIDYDARGQQVRSRTYGVNSGGNTTGYLEDNLWYDQAGRVSRSAPSGSRTITVNHYDALGRMTNNYTGYVPAASSSSSSSGAFDPSDVSGVVVIQQNDITYDDAGNTISGIVREAKGTPPETGPLSDSGNLASAVASYMASYPDGIGRTVAMANYGAVSSWSRSDTIPPASDDILVSLSTFDAAGNLTRQTDPSLTISLSEYDHADRVVRTVQNYRAATSSSSSSSSSSLPADLDQNKTSHTTYTDDSLVAMVTNDNDTTGPQTTQWIYGVSPLTGSKVASNRLVYQTNLPARGNSSSSYPASDHLITYRYNVQGQVITMIDQAGTTHGYGFDRLGRAITDTVSSFGTGIDNYVGSLLTVFDVRGLPSRKSSYAPNGTDLRNEVQTIYNDFGQAATVYQSPAGSGSSGGSSTKQVSYTYADPASSGTINTIRPVNITYPGGTVLTWDYSSATADALSRAEGIIRTDTTPDKTVADYLYTGLGRITAVSYTTPNSSISCNEDRDRFQRSIETKIDMWQGGTPTPLVHTQNGRSRFGAVTWLYNVAAHNLGTPAGLQQDNYYWYDGLKRVTGHQRGTLNAYHTGITSPVQNEVFDYDQMGNWRAYQSVDINPAQLRDFNGLNEITKIKNPSGAVTPEYDPSGNMTVIPKPSNWGQSNQLTWDAWNRLVEIKDGLSSLGAYRYDALSRRIVTTTSTDIRYYYYSKIGQVLEEWVSSTQDRSYVWGLRSARDLILRRDDTSLSRIIYALNDDSNCVAIARDTVSGAEVVERYSYDSYGLTTFLNPDFTVTSDHKSAFEWDYLFRSTFLDKTGLISGRGTVYSPALGRFIGQIMMNPQSTPGTTGGLQTMRELGYGGSRWNPELLPEVVPPPPPVPIPRIPPIIDIVPLPFPKPTDTRTRDREKRKECCECITSSKFVNNGTGFEGLFAWFSFSFILSRRSFEVDAGNGGRARLEWNELSNRLPSKYYPYMSADELSQPIQHIDITDHYDLVRSSSVFKNWENRSFECGISDEISMNDKPEASLTLPRRSLTIIAHVSNPPCCVAAGIKPVITMTATHYTHPNGGYNGAHINLGSGRTNG